MATVINANFLVKARDLIVCQIRKCVYLHVRSGYQWRLRLNDRHQGGFYEMRYVTKVAAAVLSVRNRPVVSAATAAVPTTV